ncbi:MAG: DNA starvation/stationary phase protection protein [Cytophagaceae bacterium]|nr:DNA starvation/stationary phase protection protein [Cytophagaceae bacterium]
MISLSPIGLDHEKGQQLALRLNVLLATYQVFYSNVRGFHWNIQGEKFFELHLKFEELYSNLQIKIDEIAERILTLGETPLHTFSDYLDHSAVHEAKHIQAGREAVEVILLSFQAILKQERKLLQQASEAGDEGTNALMSDYIREQEKLVWMYSAYLK